MMRVCDGAAYCARQGCDTRLARVVNGTIHLPRGWSAEEPDEGRLTRRWTKGARQRRMEWNAGHQYVIPMPGAIVCPKCGAQYAHDRIRK